MFDRLEELDMEFKDRIPRYKKFPEEYNPLDFIKGEERSILRKPIIGWKELSVELKINESAVQKHLENFKKTVSSGALTLTGAGIGRWLRDERTDRPKNDKQKYWRTIL